MKTQAAKNGGRKSGRSKKPTAKKSKAQPTSNRWPIERDILWRPHRFAYLQGQGNDKAIECVFCDALSKGLNPDSLVIWQNGTSMVVLNKFPYNNGHLLVLPVRHVADLTDLKEGEFADVHKAVRMCVAALRKAYDKVPPGMNIGANLGAAAGAGIPQHLHYHIIPRWIGDSNFFPLVGQTKVISETLEQTYKRLLPYFE
ncbi:MAG: HIT domain-containing protein [Bdellovibrionia bacterium]